MTFASRFRSLVARLRSTLGSLVSRRRLEREMETELALHIENRTADLIRSGAAPEAAARQARIELGNPLTHKEGMRAALGLRWLDELSADLRYAVRLFLKSPGFTAIAATSLGLAIGANTAIFSLAKSLLYDRLNIPHPERLLLFRWTGDEKVAMHNGWGDFDDEPGHGTSSSSFPYPVYLEMAKHPTGVESLAAFKETGMNATIRGLARRVEVAMVSGNYYDALQVHTQLGRPIQPSDDAVPDAGNAVVISDSVWDREFQRSPQVLGQVITVNQQKLTIVGVSPAGFTGAKSVLASPDLFVPISLEPLLRPQRNKQTDLANPDFWWVNVVGHLAPGASVSSAQAAMGVQFQTAVKALLTIKNGETIPHLQLTDGSRGLHSTDRIFRKPMSILLAFTGLVLLLACANIANLLLARGAQRQREMSVRLALGAGRGRVIRQLLTESLLLAALGGFGGLLLGYLCRNALPHLLRGSGDDPVLSASFDWGVFVCTALVILTTGILFGLAPAWLAARAEVSSTLKESAQTTTRRRRGFSGKTLVGVQIALSTLLIVGAGLFLRTLTALNAQNFGFDVDHLILFDINPPSARYSDGKDILLHEDLERRLAALPGVQRASLGVEAYLADSMSNTDFFLEGEVYDKSKKQAEYYNLVGNDFFPTLGIPILAGRGFGTQETASSPKVAVINQALARKRFPNQNPIGKLFRTDILPGGHDAQIWYRIVGICGDSFYASLRDEPPPQFFLPYVQQKGVGGMTYELRTSMTPAELAPALRRIVQAVDRDLPVTDVRTQREQINTTLQIERTLAALTSGFGVLALALAAVGIYGVMAYSVAQRTNEIGIRLALGAQPGQVRRMILRESIGITLIGIATGAVGAFVLARLIKSMLYGVVPYDPVTLGGGVTLLIAVALAASWIPARRAAGVEPMRALRHE